MITDAQMDAIAERAADKAIEKIYAEVGKNVLRRLAWLIGLIVISVALWLAGNKALHP